MKKTDIKKLAFEEALAELEKIVDSMENGTLALADNLKAYETGMLLSQHCTELLKTAQGRVAVLIKDGEGWHEAPLSGGDEDA